MSRGKRLAAVVAVMLIISCVLTMNVFASVDGVGGGFSLWNLLDGIGGFFRDLINAVGGFFEDVILALKYLGNAILDGFVKIVKAIGNAIGYLLSGIKWLFVPSKESFSNFRDDILTRFDKKFGSVFSALNYLNTRFGSLEAKSDLYDTFKITFPKESFLYGLSINLLSSPLPVLMFYKFCLTGLCCLVTALMCCQKVIAMVKQ